MLNILPQIKLLPVNYIQIPIVKKVFWPYLVGQIKNELK